MDARPRRRHSVSFPLFLIGGGLYLLAWNLGLTAWSPWQVATTFWPLLLVGVGLDLLLGRVSGWIAIPLTAVLLAALAAAVLALTGHIAGNAWPGRLETTTVAVPADGATSARFELDLAGGRLNLGAGPSGVDDLVGGTASTFPGWHLVTSQVRTDGDLQVTLRSRRSHGSVAPMVVGGPFPRQRWDLRLRPGLPLSLDAEATAAEGRIDLTGLDVPRVRLELTAAEGDLIVPESGADTDADLQVTLGHLAVIVPDGVAARIRVERALASVRVDQGRFPRRHGFYESDGYATATRRVTVTIDATLSDVTVR
jgi:hypothetical protein